VWHNIAYEIEFPSRVTFWHSEGGEPLTKKAGPVAVSASSNGADWHLGVLELPRSGYPDTDGTCLPIFLSPPYVPRLTCYLSVRQIEHLPVVIIPLVTSVNEIH
jgi:hypothetical protein